MTDSVPQKTEQTTTVESLVLYFWLVRSREVGKEGAEQAAGRRSPSSLCRWRSWSCLRSSVRLPHRPSPCFCGPQASVLLCSRPRSLYTFAKSPFHKLTLHHLVQYAFHSLLLSVPCPGSSFRPVPPLRNPDQVRSSPKTLGWRCGDLCPGQGDRAQGWGSSLTGLSGSAGGLFAQALPEEPTLATGGQAGGPALHEPCFAALTQAWI